MNGMFGMRSKLQLSVTNLQKSPKVGCRFRRGSSRPDSAAVGGASVAWRPGSSVLQYEVYYFAGFCNDVLLTSYVPATKNSQFNREENNPRLPNSRDSKCYRQRASV